MTAALTLTHALPRDIVVVQAPLVAEFGTLMEQVGALQEVVDADTCNAATAANTALCKLASKIEKARKALTKPIDDLKKACMEKEKEFTQPIEEARTAIEAELTGYLRRVNEEARQREFVRQQEQNLATTNGEAHLTPALIPMEPVAEVGTMKTRMVCHLVVTAIGEIPLQYLEVKETELKKFLQANANNQVKGAHLEWREEIVA